MSERGALAGSTRRGGDAQASPANGETVGELAKRVVHHVNVLARDHVDLARIELGKGMRKAALEAIGVMLGGVVALIGFAMLCVAGVVALEPVLEPLWARLLLAAVVYLAIGGAVAAGLMSKLKRDVTPELPKTRREVRETTHALKEQVQHG
jgi:uncharacterized membrane protein YqjE